MNAIWSSEDYGCSHHDYLEVRDTAGNGDDRTDYGVVKRLIHVANSLSLAIAK
ncbi:hypothetical protein [Nostoc sp. UIC 10630]|uniref:hypothetical protein n=2 Tax=unclassified Nostoc TaxID=2593658 RepID=UPI0013D3EAAE|nr:hypothetical protein [Nostoc sp. UIC 10630]NEU79492.1 hypothetical protein [Nostoc sp. UIC 10630]